MKKSQKKVVLGHIGDFEVYVYPYDYPDTVFIGEFPVSTQIEKGNETSLLRCYNKIRAYFANSYYNKDSYRETTNSRRRAIKKAYNIGMKEKTEAKKRTITPT